MFIEFKKVQLFVLLVATTNVCAELCSDLNDALCGFLIEKTPNTCGDPCLSKYCKRSCGLCPLQCYECNEIADVTNCSTLVECTNPNDTQQSGRRYCGQVSNIYFMQDTHLVVNVKSAIKRKHSEKQVVFNLGNDVITSVNLIVNNETASAAFNGYCFIAQTFTTHFTEAYRQGCGSRQTCLQYASSTGANLGRVEAGCCNIDRCNNIPPTLLKLTPEPNITNTEINLDTDSCTNQNDDVCTRLSLYMVNPCDDACIAANVCPKMCRKCFKCLNCNEATSPEECRNTTTCGFGKQCYGLEKLGKDFRPVVQLGCIDEEKCNTLQSNPVHIFGKRDFSFAGYCCSGERCNDRPVKDQISTTKATVTTAAMVPSTTPKELLTTDVPTTTKQPIVYPNSCSHNEVYTDKRACPHYYNRYNNHTCYIESYRQLRQSDAVQFCREHCGVLTRFNSMDELKRLLDYLGQYHISSRYSTIPVAYWIGMDRDEHGQWFWSEDRSPVPTSITDSQHSRLHHYTFHVCAKLDVTFVNGRVSQYFLTPEYCNRYHYKIYFKAIKLFVLFVLLVATNNVCAELCSDLNAALCGYLIEKAPTTCRDPCLSKYCRRSCNLCPLQCYECSEIADVTNCSTLVECTNPNDYCFIAQTFTSHFTEAYRQGCGSRQTCLQYASSTGTNLGRVEAGCCNMDRCNNIPPTLLKLTPEPNITNKEIILDMDNCAKQNDDLCTRLSLYMVNPCNDACIAANVCPKMCRKCFKCLNCKEAASPDACRNTTTCGFGKQCYGLEKLGKDFRPVVQLGCIDEEKCNTLQSSPLHIFGKRDFSFAGYCCSGERCNDRPLKDQVITTTAPVTTAAVVSSTTPKEVLTTDVPATTEHSTVYPNWCYNKEVYTDKSTCPRHYNRFYNHTCYMDIYDPLQHSDAVEYCRHNCGTLISFSSMDDIKSLLAYIGQYHISGRYNNIEMIYWTDMERDEHGNWFWSHDQSPVPASIINSQHSALPHYELHVCAMLGVTFTRGRVSNYYLRSTYCNTYHSRLCQLI